MVMEAAELTRGGFYNHFKSKEELFAGAVSSFLMGAVRSGGLKPGSTHRAQLRRRRGKC
jgi:AcrR family transcriptional regulator